MTVQGSTSHHFIAEPDPTDAYDKLYSCVRTDARLDLKAKWVYTIVAGAARKSRELHIDDEALTNLTGLSERSNRDALNLLCQHGLILIETRSLGKGQGKQRSIKIPRLTDVYTPAKSAAVTVTPAKSAFTPAKSAVAYKEELTDVLTDDITPPTPPPGKAEDEDDPWGETDAPTPPGNGHQSLAQSSSSQTKTHVSNEVARESDNPYWTQDRLDVFRSAFSAYPKPGSATKAAVAWREVVGVKADVSLVNGERKSTQWFGEFWRNMERWRLYWNRTETEDRYIPEFANFIRNDRYRQKPGAQR